MEQPDLQNVAFVDLLSTGSCLYIAVLFRLPCEGTETEAWRIMVYIAKLGIYDGKQEVTLRLSDCREVSRYLLQKHAWNSFENAM